MLPSRLQNGVIFWSAGRELVGTAAGYGMAGIARNLPRILHRPSEQVSLNHAVKDAQLDSFGSLDWRSTKT